MHGEYRCARCSAIVGHRGQEAESRSRKQPGCFVYVALCKATLAGGLLEGQKDPVAVQCKYVG